MMPALTAYKFQMIDVVVGKPFKDGMCSEWADWMLKGCATRGTTPAGNYKHPTPLDCNGWISKVWSELSMGGVKKKAEELGMAAAPGPEVQGYVDEAFRDAQPSGEEEVVRDPDLERDLAEAEDE